MRLLWRNIIQPHKNGNYLCSSVAGTESHVTQCAGCYVCVLITPQTRLLSLWVYITNLRSHNASEDTDVTKHIPDALNVLSTLYKSVTLTIRELLRLYCQLNMCDLWHQAGKSNLSQASWSTTTNENASCAKPHWIKSIFMIMVHQLKATSLGGDRDLAYKETILFTP